MLKQGICREELLFKVLEIISSDSNIDDIKKSLVTEIGKAFNCNRCFIRIFNEKTYEFKLVDSSSEYLSSSEELSLVGYKIEGQLNKFLIDVYKNSKGLIIPDLDSLLGEYSLDDATLYLLKDYLKVKSSYSFPVFKKDLLIGSFVLQYTKEPVELDNTEIELLKTISKQVVSVIKQYKLNEQVKRINEREKLIKSITATIRNTLNIEQIKENIVREIGKTLNASRCQMVEYDKHNDKFLPIRIAYLSNKKIPSPIGIELDIEAPEFAKKIRKREPVIFNNVPQYIKTNQLENSVSLKYIQKNKIKAGFGVPIIYQNELLGILAVNYIEKPTNFGQDDILFVQSLTDQIGIALHQAKLYENQKQTAEREKVLRQLMELIRSSLDINKIIHTFTFEIGRLFEATRIFYSKYDSSQDHFLTPDENAEYLASTNLKRYRELGKTFETAYPFFKEALKSMVEIIVIPNVEEFIKQNNLEQTPDARTLREYNIQSAIVVPVIYQNILLGGYALSYDKPHSFSQENIDFIKTISAQTAIAIYQAKLYAKERQSAEREKLSREITNSIRSTIDINEIKQRIVTEFGITYGVDRCVIHQIDPRTNKFHIIDEFSEYRSSSDVVSYVGIDLEGKDKQYSYFTELFKSGKGIISHNWDDFMDKIEPSLVSLETKELIKTLEIKSNYVFPIIYKEMFLGTVYLNYRKQRILTEDEIKTIRTTIDQIGVALYQCLLFDETKQATEKEKILNNIINTANRDKSLDETLLSICEEIGKFYNIPNVFIGQLNYKQKHIKILKEYFAHKKMDTEIIDNNLFFNYLDKSGLNNIVDNIETSNLQEKLQNVFQKANIQSFASLSIKTDEKEKTGIFFFSDKEVFFSREHDFLKKVAAQLSSCIRESDIYLRSQFVSNVSHELKTPIAICKAYTEAIINHDINELDRNHGLSVILNNLERLDSIINNLLLLSKIEQKLESKNIELKYTDLKKAVDDAIEACSLKAGNKNIKISFIHIDNIQAHINPVMFYQALVNLIINAINYSPENTKIEVSLKRDKNEISISVKDQGEGIEEKHLSKVFERFYCVDKSKSRQFCGTGLGLSIVKLVAELHKGSISVVSKLNEGSMFIISMPTN